MEPFQQRIVDEHIELQSKIFKLQFFVDRRPEFKHLHPAEKLRMLAQLNAMKVYGFILEERITHFMSDASSS